MTNPTVQIRPQVGPQWDFLSTTADIAIGGGGAGGGKTWGLLLEPLRHVNNPKFGAVVFRREYPQIINEGGPWDKSREIYPYVGGRPREHLLDWRFPSGAKVRFAHLQRDEDRYTWDGAEVPLLLFDQLESFTKNQFFYLLSRNRSTCGVRPYVRATCNPDPDHFLRRFLDWWIDPETGLAIPERSGIVRWFVHIDDRITWGATAEELKKEFGGEAYPKSATFIPSNIYDNKILLAKDPGYLANLNAQQRIDRERKLHGNWNIRESAGMYFQRQWFEIVDAAPAGVDDIRYWDRAAKKAKPGVAEEKQRGSRTAGVRIRKTATGQYYVMDTCVFRGSPLDVEKAIKNCATQDGDRVRIGIEGDPGQAGVAEAGYHVRNLAGYDARINPVHDPKKVRAKPFSAQCEAGNVKLVRGEWNDAYLEELEAFDGSDTCMADQVDASSGAFAMLTNAKQAGTWGR